MSWDNPEMTATPKEKVEQIKKKFEWLPNVRVIYRTVVNYEYAYF